MSDILDDLAAFLMHRTADAGTSESQRMTIFVLVGGYQEGDNPPLIAAALRIEAAAFAAHPDYRAEWAVPVDGVSDNREGLHELLRDHSGRDDLLVRVAVAQRRGLFDEPGKVTREDGE